MTATRHNVWACIRSGYIHKLERYVIFSLRVLCVYYVYVRSGSWGLCIYGNLWAFQLCLWLLLVFCLDYGNIFLCLGDGIFQYYWNFHFFPLFLTNCFYVKKKLTCSTIWHFQFTFVPIIDTLFSVYGAYRNLHLHSLVVDGEIYA